nr:cytochrome P450 [Anoplophora glabripennis]
MLLSSSWLIDISLLLSITVYILYKYFSRNYDYWKKKGVYYLKPKPFIGNLYDVITFKKTMAHWQQDVYKSTDGPYVGVFVFHKPVLSLRSPELIKEVLMKHFDHFSNRTALAPEHNQIFANTLFLLKNPEWKLMRSKVTPAFTSGKLRGMFPIIKNIGHEMNMYLNKNRGLLEAKDLGTKYAAEVIARTAFGINARCFDEEKSSFYEIVSLFFDFNWKTAASQTAFFFMHGVASLLRLEFVDINAVKYLKEVFSRTIEQREKSNGKGNDLIDIIVELKKDKEFCNRMKFEGEKIVSQPMQFFAAGVETTSSAISFTLYELCIHPEIQNKLREEIRNYLTENKEITYENLTQLKYMEMCILETLRRYPALPFLDRLCNKDFTIPGTDILIEKGTLVYIPLLGLHFDEKYFPEPDKYNPERFADKSTLNKNGLYYLPFGEGPRICLGERFAMMNVKIALINILSQFAVEPTSTTPVPINFTKKSFTLRSNVGLPMRLVECN